MSYEEVQNGLNELLEVTNRLLTEDEVLKDGISSEALERLNHILSDFGWDVGQIIKPYFDDFLDIAVTLEEIMEEK